MAGVETILSVERLTKKFGGLIAVDNVSFSLQKGEIRAIIGPNGAGKTTLFNLITGDIKPTSGKVLYKGKDITNFTVFTRAKLGLGRSYQIINVCQRLTVRKNIDISTQSFLKKSSSPLEIIDIKKARGLTNHIIKSFNFENNAEFEAGYLSHGDQRNLETMMALALEPEVLLLDEPAAGADEESIRGMMELIKEFSKNNTVLLTDHDIKFIMGVADRITVLAQGQIIAEGAPSEIEQNKKVQEAYLGGVFT